MISMKKDREKQDSQSRPLTQKQEKFVQLLISGKSQTRPVIINHLIAKGTVDEDVVQALEDKNTGQAALMAALKEKREEAENDGNGK